MAKKQIRNNVVSLFMGFAGQGNTLTIQRPFIDLCKGDHLAALLLSQLLYWQERTEDPAGWFAKSYEDWEEELGLTEYQIKRLIKGDPRAKKPPFKLVDVGAEIKLKRSKFYGLAPTMHYRVNLGKLQNAILDIVQKRFPDNVKDLIPDIVQNQIADNVGNDYTETTSETTSEKKDIAPDGTPSEQPLKWYISESGEIVQRSEPTADEFFGFRGPYDTELEAVKALHPVPKFGFKEAVMHIWQLQPLADGKNGLEVNFVGLLSGKGKKGTAWEKHHLETPATTEEVLAFGGWYRETNGDDISMPMKAEVLHDHFLLFRQSANYREWLDAGIEQLKEFTLPPQLNTPQATQPQPESGDSDLQDYSADIEALIDKVANEKDGGHAGL